MDHHKVIRAAGTVGGCILASRILGLGRDMLMAALFGTTSYMSAFVIGFRIPNLFRAFFGEGALASAFIPVFVETRHKEGEEAGWILARKVFSMTAVAVGLLVAAIIAGIGVGLATGVGSSYTRLALVLTQLLLPYTLFICMAALAMASLNACHRFLLPAFTPCLLNLVMIVAMLGLLPFRRLPMIDQMMIVSVSVLVGGIWQWRIQIPGLKACGYRPGFDFDRRDRRVRRILLLMGPVALGQAVTRVNVFIDTMLAAAIGSWAPATLYFAERLIYLPLGMFGTALGTVLLPVFSGHAARKDNAAILGMVNLSMRMLLFVMIPAAAGLLILAGPIVQLIFEWRVFAKDSVLQTTRALAFFAPGLLMFSLNKVFVPAFYALQDTRTPVRISLWTVLANIGLSILFINTWPYWWKHAGIATATVLAEAANGCVLGLMLHRRIGSPGWRTIADSALRIAAASTIMATAAWWLCGFIREFALSLHWPEKTAQLLSVGGAIGISIAVYFVSAWLLRCPEVRDLVRAIRQRRASTPPAPGDTGTPLTGDANGGAG